MPNKELMPRFRFAGVCEITADSLKYMGVDALLLDIDNTLIYDETLTLLPGVRAWVRSMHGAGVPLAIVSNAIRPRVYIVAKRLKIGYYVWGAKKPKPDGLLKAAEKMGIPIQRLAMVGDQVRADMQAANAAGAVAVYVNPAQPERIFKWYFKKQRAGEKEILDEFDRLKGE